AQEKDKEKKYFLGTLLLHNKGNYKMHVVDGQQRLTTSVIFIAAALRINNEKNIFRKGLIKDKLLKRTFIYDEDEEMQKFHTIKEDNPFFRTQILGMKESEVTEGSPSSYRLKEAFEYFLKSVQDDEWEDLIYALVTAKLIIYSVENSADATLIFELQNDRGKKLTDLESLKSYLMHLIYLNAKNPEEGLQEIQTQFSNIYRNIEKQSSNKKIPSEDAILSYHCVANLEWKEDEWRNPKKLIKHTIKNLTNENTTQWVLGFVNNLNETYKLFTTLFDKLDDISELTELILLDRMATFWPLVITTYNHDKKLDKSDFLLACRLMEVFAMRSYGISNMRSDSGLSAFYRKAREFNGGFHNVHDFIYYMSYEYDLETRIRNGIDSATIYKNNRRDTQYLLWRYENYCRSQTGKKWEPLTWKQYLFPKNDATKLSIEHIAAQNNPISTTIVQWKEDEDKKFIEVATHRLGNLVLDSKSANSSKGKYDFTDKLKSLSKDSTFLSQGELVDWAEEDNNSNFIWTISSIKRRQEHMKQYSLKTWDPKRYYKPTKLEIIEESIEEI
ncbi:MAG: DUF262 domain-containing protein, partial [Candidatus Delongbacteria bacterium]|nr:DUF262 domain-containing protein [Candidatus Delongbacteria bacterium]